MAEAEMLLIGIGPNKNYSGEIFKIEKASDVERIYGKDSCFSRASKEIKKLGLEEYYILNIDTWEEIKLHIDEFNDYEFDYIVPLDLLIDERYYDEYYRRNLYYSQVLLLNLNDTMSTVIMTGKSSELYEDLDSFLKDESKRITKVHKVYKNLRRENMIYVANNISGFDYANAVLATALVKTDYAEYPDVRGLGTAHFDIDYSDVLNDLVYFKNNTLTGLTIENLVNFSEDRLRKIVTVFRIMKYLRSHSPVNQEAFIGKAYTEYRRYKMQDSLRDYLDGLKGWILYDYDIISITPIMAEDGTVTIHMNYDVWPKFTVEKYRMETIL